MSTLKYSSGTVYGKPYTTIEPEPGLWREQLFWCREVFGPTPEDGVWTPDARWYINNGKFWFKDPADQTLFALKFA